MSFMYILLFIFLLFLSRFLNKVNIFILPYFFISIIILSKNEGFRDFYIPVIIGSVFFFFLGVLVEKYKLDFYLEIIFQILIISSSVFLGLKIEFIRNLSGGFYYFGYEKAIIITFVWIFITINLFRIIGKNGPLFLGAGFCICLAVQALMYKQGGSGVLLTLGYTIISMYMWVLFYIFFFKEKVYDLSIFYFLSYITICLSILGTVKSVLLVSVFLPVAGAGIPFLFILFMTIISFLRFKSGNKKDVYWNISIKRILFFTYNTIFFFTITALLYISKINAVHFSLIILISVSVLFLIGKNIFFSNVKSTTNKNIFGVNINPLNRRELVRKTKDILEGDIQNYAVTLNALMLFEASEDDFYRIILNSSDIQVVDGVGVLWAIDFLCGYKAQRISGVDYTRDILKIASKKGKKIYLLGSTQENLEKCKENMLRQNEGIEISGIRNGYFDDAEEKDIIKDINSSGAEILFVGMGVPRQEKWIFYNLHNLHNIKLAMGIGGTFDVYAGAVKRAPLWIQNLGLEWLYRTIKEPFRLARLFKIPKFVFNIIKSKISEEIQK